jgi:hypothetical protein
MRLNGAGIRRWMRRTHSQPRRANVKDGARRPGPNGFYSAKEKKG